MADVFLSSDSRRVPSLLGGRNVSGIASGINIGGTASAVANAGAIINSGSLVAGVYKTILSLTVPGTLKMCLAWRTDSTARTVGLRVTMNGAVVFDVTDLGPGFTNRGVTAVGYFEASSPTVAHDSIPFDTLEIAVKSSLTETDKIASIVVYDLD